MTNETSLDPENWTEFRASAHAALDAAINRMEGRGEAPVWQPVPQDIRDGLTADMPHQGQDIAHLAAKLEQEFLPYDVGNTHPKFFGWVHGSGTPSGLIPEMFAAAMNANLGGRDHVANYVEKQVISWCRDMFSFPPKASGLIVSGTSVATIIALKSARDKYADGDVKTMGVLAASQMVGYASTEAHSCVARAFDILGLGKANLRAIPTDNDFRMNTRLLRAAIDRDIADGLQPFCVIGTAGSVNVASIDPLDELADIADEYNLWFHIDGAFGALAVLSDTLKPLVKGIERASSLAFDFHKWMHVNYDAGFVLVRDGQDQLRAFSERPEYLEGATRGLAAGNPWFCEYGPELSRGFRALKVWFHMSHFGLDRIGEKIADNCNQARYLAELVDQSDHLTRLAPVGLNITCFRFENPDLDAEALDRLNQLIVVELQERGLAAPSTTRVNGRLAIRVNITNHRTQKSDLDALVRDVTDLGHALSNPTA